MGFVGCEAYIVKIWANPKGKWTVYFIDEQNPNNLAFSIERNSFGEAVMAVVLEGTKYRKGKI